LPRHLKRKHGDEEAVAAAVKLSKPEQDKHFHHLRKLAILNANLKIRASGGTSFHRQRRTNITKPDTEANDLVMCNGCHVVFFPESGVGNTRNLEYKVTKHLVLPLFPHSTVPIHHLQMIFA
jgi:hypothetical protein